MHKPVHIYTGLTNVFYHLKYALTRAILPEYLNFIYIYIKYTYKPVYIIYIYTLV